MQKEKLKKMLWKLRNNILIIVTIVAVIAWLSTMFIMVGTEATLVKINILASMWLYIFFIANR